MLCAQYGNSQSYYGNIQYGFFNPQPYIWGAWQLPYPQHYQPSLTEYEDRVIEEHRGYTPSYVPQESNESIILRMQHEVRMREVQDYRPQPVKPEPVRMRLTPINREQPNYDDEDYFILM